MMSTETCIICKCDSTPWVSVEKGHMCEDCYQKTERKWIRTDERLPDDLVDVLYVAVNETGKRDVVIGHREDQNWTCCSLYWTCCSLYYQSQKLNMNLVTITHWMPLPEHPHDWKTSRNEPDE